MAREKIWAVYKISSIIKPERVYIGSTTTLKYRWWDHKWRLRRDKHHSPHLQYHYNKYGLEDLKFEVIESIDIHDWDYLIKREQYYIDTLNPYFNASKTAGSPSTIGKKQPDWLVEKRASKTRGVKRGPMAEEHKKHLRESKIRGGKGNGLKGKPKSKETSQKISNTLKGRKQPPRTEEHKKHLSEALMGKKVSKEARDNMSKAKKGKAPWNKGKKLPPLSEEHKKKIGRGVRKHNENRDI